jgi:hypothetical protein
MKSNQGLLAGIRCPACGGLGPFDIDVTLNVKVEDKQFWVNHDAGLDLDDNAGCRCCFCGCEGIVAEFIANQKGAR